MKLPRLGLPWTTLHVREQHHTHKTEFDRQHHICTRYHTISVTFATSASFQVHHCQFPFGGAHRSDLTTTV
ncbi:hypothetical protein PM082_010608 [Marasmius tenuissimus]|nr:hypothetical protein PM082_010608 [Marasmius tenuissimus]